MAGVYCPVCLLQHRDDKYLQFLIDQHRSYGLNELLLTSDGGKTQATGSMPGKCRCYTPARMRDVHAYIVMGVIICLSFGTSFLY